MPDGKVLILGGVGTDGRVVATAELIDPVSGSVEAIEGVALQERARHSATLQMDGSVLVAGGVDASGGVRADLSRLTVETGSTLAVLGQSVQLLSARFDHRAVLLPDGETLLWGGQSARGEALQTGEVYNPASDSVEPLVLFNDPRVRKRCDPSGSPCLLLRAPIRLATPSTSPSTHASPFASTRPCASTRSAQRRCRWWGRVVQFRDWSSRLKEGASRSSAIDRAVAA